MNNVVSEKQKVLDDSLMKRLNAEKFLDHVQSRASSEIITLGNIKL